MWVKQTSERVPSLTVVISRFSQFCKPWVAAETFASDPELEKRTSEGLDKTSQAKTWLGLGWLSVFGFTKDNWRGVQQRLKGRWMTSFWVLLFLMVVISRPAFGRLCARLFGLTLRFCFRRLVTLTVLSIIDTILEEAILQAESALVPDPAPNNPTPSDNQPARDTVPSYFVHLLCMVLGALVSRQFPGTLTGPIRPPVNWLRKFCNVARLEGVGRHINKSRFVCVWCTHSLSADASAIDFTVMLRQKAYHHPIQVCPRWTKKWLGAAAVDSTLWISNMKWPLFDLWDVESLGSPPPSPPPPGKTYQQISLCVCVMQPIRYQPMLQQLISQLCYGQKAYHHPIQVCPRWTKKWLGAAAVDSNTLESQTYICILCGKEIISVVVRCYHAFCTWSTWVQFWTADLE